MPDKTTKQATSPVMDVLPWPNGYGFKGRDTWWAYVLNQGERERLDDLVGLALLDSSVQEKLLVNRDPALFAAFGLSQETQTWLQGLEATTLTEFAQAILSASSRRSTFQTADSEAA